jgi:uncharacterized protein (TIGR03437 family)
MSVVITGSNTNFTAASTVAFSGTGITVNSVSTAGATSMTANITVDPAATLSFRDVTVTTNLGGGTTETAKGAGSFQIKAAPSGATIIGATPPTGAVGQTLDVLISAINSHFVDGTSTASFGGSVTVNSLKVATANAATANVTIDAEAGIGFRHISVTTGSETANDLGNGAFLVTPPAPLFATITAVAPNNGTQGQSGLVLNITGQNTHFAQASSTLSFSNPGIAVANLTVASATSAFATINIAYTATLGFSDVLMTTGGEGAVLLSGFQILPGSPGNPTNPVLLDQTVTFPAIPDHIDTDAPFQLIATATSGLPVTFFILGGPATVNGNTLTLTGGGTVTVQAYQDGSNVYYPATATQTFNVALGKATITAIENGASLKSGPVAPGSDAVLIGTNFASSSALGDGLTTTNVAGATVTVVDASGKSLTANLSMVSSRRINLVVPSNAASGTATVTVTNSAGGTASLPFTIAPVAPAFFTADSSGSGPPAAQVLLVAADGTVKVVYPYTCFEGVGCSPYAIDLAGASQAYLILYGTGLRGGGGASGAAITIGGLTGTVLYAGPQGAPGVDQMNVLLPGGLATGAANGYTSTGSYPVDVVTTINGTASGNTVSLTIK